MKKSKKITDFVHRDSEIMGGEPVFKGTRVPVRALFDCLKSSGGIEDFKTGFPHVTEAQINAVLEFAQQNLVKTLPLTTYENAA